MEGGAGGSGRRTRLSSREVSPDRARSMPMQMQPRFNRVGAKKVQIVYYLSRNGQLEHPHFMELTLLPNQQIRLKDVMDRLTALRGKGMPALYSWSCKRSYKNGYVWNDLAENDVIYPSDGAEYVLKGSEIMPGCSVSERFHHPISNRFAPKPVSVAHKPYAEPDEDQYDVQTEDTDERDLLEHDYHGNITVAACRTPRAPKHTMIAQKKPQSNHSRQIELPLEDSSPPSSSSSEKPPNLTVETGSTRSNSMFLQLIACGAGSVSPKGSARKSSGGLHRGVVNRLAASRVGFDDEFGSVSHSTRCSVLSVEDKEYFSGSIVEDGHRAVPEPALKKSNSYNEERSTRLLGIGEGVAGTTGEEEEEVQVRAADGVKGKCIPSRKKLSAKHQPQKQ